MSLTHGLDRADTDASAAISHWAVPILLVDDDSSKRLALKAVLAPLGYYVVEANSGAAALRARHGRRLRGDPARRPDADHGRVRDGSPDPAAAAVGDDPDHLRHRAWGRRDRARPLRAGRRRLHHRTDRRRRAARQGLGVREPLHPGGGGRREGPRGPALRRPAQAAHRDRSDRHLPDRRREPLHYTNARWSEITGIPSATAIGQAWDIIIDDEQRASMAARVRGEPEQVRVLGRVSRRPGPGFLAPDHAAALEGAARRRRSYDGLGRDARRHHRRGGSRSGHGGGPRRGGQGVESQVGLPGQHEPRDPHSDERSHRSDRAPARDRPRTITNGSSRRR